MRIYFNVTLEIFFDWHGGSNTDSIKRKSKGIF